VSKIARLREALLTLLQEHLRDGALPTSARFLFYELVARGIISKDAPPPKAGKKTTRRPDQYMGDALTDLRENGEVPWDWIADETRSLEKTLARQRSLTACCDDCLTSNSTRGMETSR
jgi:hypothetical protein